MKQFKNLVQDQTITQCSHEAAKMICQVFDEVKKAEAKHPDFCRNLSHALLVIGEELGEAHRAYLQYEYEYEGKNYEEIRKELVQTAATVFRTLLNLDDMVADIGLARIESAFSNVAKEALSKLPGAYGLQAELYAEIMGGKKTHSEKCDISFAKLKERSPNANPSFSRWYNTFGKNSSLKSDFSNDTLYTGVQDFEIWVDGVNIGVQGAQAKENASKGCKQLATDLKPCEAAKQPEPFGSISEAINRICNPERNGMLRNTPRVGKSQSAIQRAYEQGGTFVFALADANIKVEVRANRVKYSVQGETMDDAMMRGVALERWVSRNLPTGFVLSHSVGVGYTVFTIAKRIGAGRND